MIKDLNKSASLHSLINDSTCHYKSYQQHVATRNTDQSISHSTFNTTNKSQNNEYNSSKSFVNQQQHASMVSTNIYNSRIEESQQQPIRIQSQKSTTPVRPVTVNKENMKTFDVSKDLLSAAAFSASKVMNFKQQQELVNRLVNERQALQQQKNTNVQQQQNKLTSQKSCNALVTMNPNSSLLKPTQSSRSKRTFI